MEAKNIFQFVLSEENKPTLFIYARESEPKNPTLYIYKDEQKIGVERNNQDRFMLNIDDESMFELLQNQQQVLVCEVIPAEGEDEVEIIRTYSAAIVR